MNHHQAHNGTRVALFGTSADPPTQGHKTILEWLSHHYDQVAVWASDNPLKSQQTPLLHRMKMLALLIPSLETRQNNVKLCHELSSPRSLETVEKAEAMWGEDTEFTFVIGSDLVTQIPRWYASEQLLKRVRLLIIPRSGYPLAETDFNPLQQMGANYDIADLSAPPVSSTAFRENGVSDVIDPSVKDYIQQQQLYSWETTT